MYQGSGLGPMAPPNGHDADPAPLNEATPHKINWSRYSGSVERRVAHQRPTRPPPAGRVLWPPAQTAAVGPSPPRLHRLRPQCIATSPLQHPGMRAARETRRATRGPTRESPRAHAGPFSTSWQAWHILQGFPFALMVLPISHSIKLCPRKRGINPKIGVGCAGVQARYPPQECAPKEDFERRARPRAQCTPRHPTRQPRATRSPAAAGGL